MKPDKHIIILLYWSLKDPLCEGLMLDYLKRMKLSGFTYHLITFEQDKYKLDAAETISTSDILRSEGIVWHPLKYRSGRFFVIKKLFSMLQTIWLIRRIKRRNNVRLLAAMASIAGAFGFFASRILNIRYCQLTFEPHAEIVMGSGGLSPDSLKYKISHRLEMHVGLNSEIVVCTSRHMVERLKKSGARGKIIRLPTCVNESRCTFDVSARNAIRTELGIQNKRVLIYPGKFGGMYGKENTIAFIAAFLADNSLNHALIITDFNRDILMGWIRKFGIDESQVTLLGPVDLEAIPRYISAADVGLIAYANFEARRYCSPVKTAEYLLCGLPYIVQQGTSEDDEYAIKYRVGVVADSIDALGYPAIKNSLDELLGEDVISLRSRCRETGLIYRSSSISINTLRGIFTDEPNERSVDK